MWIASTFDATTLRERSTTARPVRATPVCKLEALPYLKHQTQPMQLIVSPDFLCQTMDIRARSASPPLAAKRVVCVLTCAGSLLYPGGSDAIPTISVLPKHNLSFICSRGLAGSRRRQHRESPLQL